MIASSQGSPNIATSLGDTCLTKRINNDRQSHMIFFVLVIQNDQLASASSNGAQYPSMLGNQFVPKLNRMLRSGRLERWTLRFGLILTLIKGFPASKTLGNCPPKLSHKKGLMVEGIEKLLHKLSRRRSPWFKHQMSHVAKGPWNLPHDRDTPLRTFTWSRRLGGEMWWSIDKFLDYSFDDLPPFIIDHQGFWQTKQM